MEPSVRTSAARDCIVTTFSIVAADLATGDLGIAVASKFLACGAVVPWASAGAGAVATQSFANTAYGPDGIRLMRDGLSARDALAKLLEQDADRDLRQVGLVDARGGAAAHTGPGCHAWAGHLVGEGFACQGNILVGQETVDTMAAAFRGAKGELSSRLVAALAAGERAGGDKRGKQASALYVVRPKGGYGGMNDVLVDLRVDDHADPVKELSRLLDLNNLYFGTSPDIDKLPIEGDVLADLRRVMASKGFYRGNASGPWDDATAKALDIFVASENFEERVDLRKRTIDRAVLAHLRTHL
ncbi:MAG TPA: fimbrial assembly protein FimA [Verrucomicrobiales bacterium]|nr:fimbrial assembly protein FimA [Verrucomicrobiales bacterium]